MRAEFKHGRIMLVTDDMDFGEPCEIERVVSIGTARRLAEELTRAAASQQAVEGGQAKELSGDKQGDFIVFLFVLFVVFGFIGVSLLPKMLHIMW